MTSRAEHVHTARFGFAFVNHTETFVLMCGRVTASNDQVCG